MQQLANKELLLSVHASIKQNLSKIPICIEKSQPWHLILYSYWTCVYRFIGGTCLVWRLPTVHAAQLSERTMQCFADISGLSQEVRKLWADAMRIGLFW